MAKVHQKHFLLTSVSAYCVTTVVAGTLIVETGVIVVVWKAVTVLTGAVLNEVVVNLTFSDRAMVCISDRVCRAWNGPNMAAKGPTLPHET